MNPTNTTLTSSSPANVRQKALIAGFNATLLYVLAYLTATTVYQLATVLTAKSLGIPGTWGLGKVFFRISDGEWWQTAVLAVYSAGPLSCLLLGAGAGLWFWWRARRQRGLFKQFLFWLTLHGCNLFFGALVADTFTESGFWFVPGWLFMAGPIPGALLAGLFGLIQLALGYFAGMLFLQSHDSISLMKFPNRRLLLVSTLYVPWLAGSALIGLLKWPELTHNEQLHFATLLLLLAPLTLAAANELFEFTLESPQKTRVAWGLAGVALLLLLVLRVVLGSGLSFS
ncbi:hypothetical protein [Hymenobacter sp. B81]|uniref:hypothetical protein n=1 Tax=Hymenobacter sp. B81 TaxID=3344878 RepID=UPI0037DC5C10